LIFDQLGIFFCGIWFSSADQAFWI
jgi:hypothetical protein